jgi:uncharacterized protein (TIGR03118 family)
MVEPLEERWLLDAGYSALNLASDVPGLARVTDPNLVNPWGISFSPTGPFWFADNGSGVSDILDGRGQVVPLVVAVPSAAPMDGVPTGTVFNHGSGFIVSENGVAAPSRFLFAGEDGTISGWSGVVDPAHALVAADLSASGARYKGLALATDSTGRSFLYAADFSHGTIDIFDATFHQTPEPGAFADPNVPAGFAPFNIQNIGDRLFVTYAQRDAKGYDNVTGPGLGFIDVYSTGGALIQRFAAAGALNAPWGLALAPADFGPYSGALLVGNEGDGRILAYDPHTGALEGALTAGDGKPLAIPDLWALTFGNGHLGGDANTLFFTAGVSDEQHGLFGAIQAPDRRGADTGGTGPFDDHAAGETGDYPLPPPGGPPLRSGTLADRAVVSAELMPLAGSPLLLVPTLSPASVLRATGDATAAAALLDVSTARTVISHDRLPAASEVPAALTGHVPIQSSHATGIALPPDRIAAEVCTRAVTVTDCGKASSEPSRAAETVDVATCASAHQEVANETDADRADGARRPFSPWSLVTHLLLVVGLPAFWRKEHGRDRPQDLCRGEGRERFD